MQAAETKIQQLIEGTKQYLVPLFQRAYSWDKKEWRTLWLDLMDLCAEENPRPHFMGSVVTLPTMSVPEGVAKFLVIDGQQRLTTTFIILALVRDFAKAGGAEELADEIHNTLLVNQYKKDNDYFKFQPTQADRAVFSALIKERIRPPSDSQIGAAYAFFERELKKKPEGLELLKKTITSVLSTVSIVLDPDDNPYLVFESLNAKGRPLTQADLVRNFFIMRIHVDRQEDIFEKYWRPMQTRLGDRLTDFFRHFLTKAGDVVKIDDIYFEFKDKVTPANVENTLSDLARYSEYYEKLLSPEKEQRPSIRDGLKRLATLDVGVSYPFLLNCYDEFDRGELSELDFAAVLDTLTNFVIRRFVCNVGSFGMNRELAVLYRQAKKEVAFVAGVKKNLVVRRYPKDNEFRRALTEVSLYGAGERATKAKLILLELERGLNPKEQVAPENVSVEHVMPQTLTFEWKADLGEEADDTHELFLHTLGNLTLTAYNSEMSNDVFAQKRNIFLNSNFALNREIAALTEWNREEIESRGRRLGDRALKIWPYFGDADVEQANEEPSSKRKKPKELLILGQKIEVETWRDVVEQTMITIASLEPEKLESIANRFPKFVSSEPGKFRSSRPIGGGFHIDTWLSAERAKQFCEKAIVEVGLSEDDWSVRAV
jgi:uncharacterized protein with ParB-like and HNH nuclease domain